MKAEDWAEDWEVGWDEEDWEEEVTDWEEEEKVVVDSVAEAEAKAAAAAEGSDRRCPARCRWCRRNKTHPDNSSTTCPRCPR